MASLELTLNRQIEEEESGPQPHAPSTQTIRLSRGSTHHSGNTFWTNSGFPRCTEQCFFRMNISGVSAQLVSQEPPLSLECVPLPCTGCQVACDPDPRAGMEKGPQWARIPPVKMKNRSKESQQAPQRCWVGRPSRPCGLKGRLRGSRGRTETRSRNETPGSRPF